MNRNQTNANQYDDIFRDPDYIQEEKSEIELVVDDQTSEQEIDNLDKIKSEEEVIDMKKIHPPNS